MGEYPILEGYSANFQQLSMRPFDLRSKGCQQPVSWSRLPRPSPRSCPWRFQTAINEHFFAYFACVKLLPPSRCVRLSDVGMSYLVITYSDSYNKVSYKVGYKSIFFTSLYLFLRSIYCICQGVRSTVLGTCIPWRWSGIRRLTPAVAPQ
jgi:hypothetical protein